jgi:hypothetical protein
LLSDIVLKNVKKSDEPEESGKMFRVYKMILGPLLGSRLKRMLALGSVVLLLLLAVTLVPLK